MSTEPQTKLTLWDRLLADSPAFWKKVNYLGLIIGAVVAAIQTQFPEFPKTWLGLLAGISVGLVTASQFAVKDTGALAKQNPTIDDYVNTAADIKNQYQEVKQAVINASDLITKPEPEITKNSVLKDAQAKIAKGTPDLAPLSSSIPCSLSGIDIPTATLTGSTPPPENNVNQFGNPAGNQPQ